MAVGKEWIFAGNATIFVVVAALSHHASLAQTDGVTCVDTAE